MTGEARRGISPLWILPALLFGIISGASCASCVQLPIEPPERVFGGDGPRVGVVEVVGPIVDMSVAVRQVREFGRRDDIEALLVRLDSPGGAVAPSQEVFDAMRSVAEDKPVVASMGNVAASGAFWIALGADWVVAEPGTITGSIGVIFQGLDLTDIAERLDFRVRTFKTGPVKDLANPLRELKERDREVIQGLLDDIYDQFVTTTAIRRGLSREEVLPLADGQILTGRAALEAGLVDELGGLHHAARRAAVLARIAAPETTETSTSALMETLDDPMLVYPRPPPPEFLQFLGASLENAVARGVEAALEAVVSRSVPTVR
ncbi:MAG: signal peptide peptidase SppA [Myxococcota bacterium]